MLMRKMLTISEMSNLLEISTHTIRYYEKEGLITPSDRTSGGYRLYDIDALDRFEAIILLRECGISIKGVKDFFNNYSEDNYNRILDDSYKSVNDEIKRLMVIKRKLALVRSVRKDFVDGEFKCIEMPKVVLKSIGIVEENIFKSSMAFYDFFSKNSVDLLDNKDGYYYFTTVEEDLILCKKMKRIDKEYHIFESGKYLNYSFMGDVSNLDISKIYKVIKKHTNMNRIEITGKPLIQLSSIRSMAIGDEKNDIIEVFFKII